MNFFFVGHYKVRKVPDFDTSNESGGATLEFCNFFYNLKLRKIQGGDFSRTPCTICTTAYTSTAWTTTKTSTCTVHQHHHLTTCPPQVLHKKVRTFPLLRRQGPQNYAQERYSVQGLRLHVDAQLYLMLRSCTRLLHPHHLDGIWTGQTPYRLPYNTLSEYPEPWSWKISVRGKERTYNF